MRKIKGEIKRNFPRIYDGHSCRDCYFYYENGYSYEGFCDMSGRPLYVDTYKGSDKVCKHFQLKEDDING